MLRHERLIRALIILGIFSALIYLGQFVWRIGESLSDLILLLALAWLVAYVLTPIARWLNSVTFPKLALNWVQGNWGDRPAGVLAKFHLPYELAAVLLYLAVLFALVLTIILAVPGIIKQLGLLAVRAPDYIQHLPDWWAGVQDTVVQRFNVDRETLARAVPIEQFVQEATSVVPDIIGNAVTVVQTIASGVANTLLVLILSLYIMLDGRRLSEQFYRVVPLRYQDEAQFVFNTVDRTFGAFLRGQVLMALIMGLFVGLVMRLFGLQFTMVTAVVSGLIMLIPELGAPIAMIAPSVASALQGSNATFALFIILLVFQQILLRFIIPSIISQAIGMPPLLVLVSMLVSARVMGLWGFIFGIPISGAIYIIAFVTLEQMKQAVDARDRKIHTEEQVREVLGQYVEQAVGPKEKPDDAH